MHCLIVKVWCKFDQNWTKAIKVTEHKPYTPLNQRFAGGGLIWEAWEHFLFFSENIVILSFRSDFKTILGKMGKPRRSSETSATTSDASTGMN